MPNDAPEPAFDEATADQRLGRDRRDIVATLTKADCRMRAGDHRAANAFYKQVIRLAAAGIMLPTAELARANEATAWLAERFREAIETGLSDAGITRNSMHPRFAASLDLMFGRTQREPVATNFPQAPNMYFYPGLPHVEFADPRGWNWIEAIEAGTDAILAEAERLLEGGQGFAPYVKPSLLRPQGDVHGLLNDPSWSTLDLTDKGRPDPAQIARAPLTWQTIAGSAPLCDIPNRSPSVMFSLLRAHSRIPPHTGMINTRYICHLPLIVPGNGALRVGNATREWQLGKLIVFDDSIEHEAWNDADRDRLVLIFDIWRPEISATERDQIRALFTVVDAY